MPYHRYNNFKTCFVTRKFFVRFSISYVRLHMCFCVYIGQILIKISGFEVTIVDSIFGIIIYS